MRFSCTRRGLAACVVSIVAATAGATVGRAQQFEPLDDPAQLDEMAAAVQKTSNSLCWEMHRYHREQPGYPEAYRQAKELWSMAGTLREALRTGAIDPATLMNQVTRMSEALAAVQSSVSTWGDGVRPPLDASPPPGERSVVVTPGRVDVDIPLLFGGGIRVGSPPRAVVVEEPTPPALPRRQFHPNSRGSRRSLERELTAVRTAMDYLLEDAGVAPPAEPAGESPTPMPPEASETSAGPSLSPPIKVAPRAEK